MHRAPAVLVNLDWCLFTNTGWLMAARAGYSTPHLTLGRIRQHTRHHWWTYYPSRALDTAVTTLRIGHSHLHSHLHKLDMTENLHCPWYPTQPDTPEHLKHFPRHHSHRIALLQTTRTVYMVRIAHYNNDIIMDNYPYSILEIYYNLLL